MKPMVSSYMRNIYVSGMTIVYRGMGFLGLTFGSPMIPFPFSFSSLLVLLYVTEASGLL